MKKNIIKYLALPVLAFSAVCCTNLDEHVYNKVDKNVYYKDEASLQAAVASIYHEAQESYSEWFYYLQELSADQIAWRVWNTNWGYDEGEKYVLSIQHWNSESKIILSTWQKAWTTVGLCNNILADMQSLNPADLNIDEKTIASYEAEVRTLRAWAYYNIFEIWGGAIPLYTGVASTTLPQSESRRLGSFEKGCASVVEFISNELDETLENLPVGEVNRMNQAANRLLRARLALNTELFTGTADYDTAERIAREIINGDYGSYSIDDDYRTLYSTDNRTKSHELIMGFACEFGQSSGSQANMRNTPFFGYAFKDVFGCPSISNTGWNCMIIVPSHDNSGTIVYGKGTDTGGKSFLEAPYNDKLGAVVDRFDTRDIRRQPFTCDLSGNWKGNFAMGYQYKYGTTDPVEADASCEYAGSPLYYVDQVATFKNAASVEDVMSSYYGEDNSGYRFVKYPAYPDGAGDYRSIDEVEFRLAEAYYIVAECLVRKGDSEGAKDMVDAVRGRYFSASDKASALSIPGPGFTAFDKDWMLSEWGKEFLGEGRRRRTDLRRFDKFTQGQWWFMGRGKDAAGGLIPATRDRKYEWFPLPSSVFQTNSGLEQNPNY